jgi:hypothetical protein
VPAQEKGGPEWPRDWNFVFHRSPFPFPSPAFCRFSLPFLLPFLLPLLVAVWQSKINARYNIVEEGTAGVEQILENSAFSVHCLLLTAHCSLLTAPRVAIEPRGVIFNCSLLPASRFTAHCSLLTEVMSHVTKT